MDSINFQEIIKNHDLQYAHRIYPSILFANQMISNPELTVKSLSFAKDLLVNWDANADDAIFTEDVTDRFLKTLAHGVLSPSSNTNEVIGFWLSYCVGFIYRNNTDIEFMYDLLMHMFYSYDGRGFVHAFTPTKELTQLLLNNVDYSVDRLLRRCRLANDEESVKEYIHYFSSKSLDEKLHDVSLDSFYEDFRPLPSDVILLSDCLIKSGLYKEWCDVFISLSIPFLQVELLSHIRNSGDIIPLYSEMCKINDAANKKISLMILKNKWFYKLIWNTENYLKPLPVDIYDEEVKKSYMFHHKNANTHLSDIVNDIVSLFVKHEDIQTISEWIFTKSMKKSKVNTHIQAYNLALGKLQEAVIQISNVEDLSIDVQNLHYLAYVANEYVRNNVKGKNVKKLLSNIWIQIKSANFYWPSSLDDQDLIDMRSIARLLASDIDETKINNIIADFRVLYEGVNAVHMKDWNKKSIAESYVYCILLFIHECDDIEINVRNRYFRIISESLLKQCHCCGMDLIVESNYKTALILAEIIADQILTERKDDFEKSLIENIYKKKTAIEVLAYAKTNISKDVKSLVTTFKDGDWMVIRNDYLRRNMNNEVSKMESLFAAVLR